MELILRAILVGCKGSGGLTQNMAILNTEGQSIVKDLL